MSAKHIVDGYESVAPGDPRLSAEIVHSYEEAARRALERTQPGDWILIKASREVGLEKVLEAMIKLTDETG